MCVFHYTKRGKKKEGTKTPQKSPVSHYEASDWASLSPSLRSILLPFALLHSLSLSCSLSLMFHLNSLAFSGQKAVSFLFFFPFFSPTLPFSLSLVLQLSASPHFQSLSHIFFPLIPSCLAPSLPLTAPSPPPLPLSGTLATVFMETH